MKSKAARLLLLITNLGKGGAQRVFFDHSLFLQHQYEVAEAVFDTAEEERLYNSGLPLYSLDVKAGQGPFGKIRNLWKRVDSLKKLIAKQKIELVISHMDGANWINVLAGSRHKKILVVHGTILYDQTVSKRFQKFRLKVLIPLLYKRADCVVAVSEGIKEELKNYCGLQNVITIPNFFDLKSIQKKALSNLPAEWTPVFSFPTLVTSGRMHEQKKQRFLLPVLQQLKKDISDLKLIILGDGELRNALLQEAKSFDLRVYSTWDAEKNLSTDYDVYFLGYVENPFVFLNKSTVFVFPSAWEGFPLALCEAMIAGVPVLAADCPTGPREILDPGSNDLSYSLTSAQETDYGYLMPMPDKSSFVSEWVKIINSLITNPEKRQFFIRQGQTYMLNYDSNVILQRWQKLIDNIVKI